MDGPKVRAAEIGLIGTAERFEFGCHKEQIGTIAEVRVRVQALHFCVRVATVTDGRVGAATATDKAAVEAGVAPFLVGERVLA